MTTKLVLIRHGITEWNKQGRYCGYRDVDLSSQGKLQVIKLKKKFEGVDFDKIYCSDRKRALQTKTIIFGKAVFTKVKDLREIHFGVFEGLKHAQILDKYPQVYKKWLKDPYRTKIPKAESMPVFKKRILKAIKKIIWFNRGKNVAVVCHGGVIGIFVSSLLKNRNFWQSVPAAASVTIVEYKHSKFKLKKFNDKTHLR